MRLLEGRGGEEAAGEDGGTVRGFEFRIPSDRRLEFPPFRKLRERRVGHPADQFSFGNESGADATINLQFALDTA